MYRIKFYFLAVMIFIMFFGGTVYGGSGLMVEADRSLTPKPDQALIILMRPSSYAFAISASVFDVSGDETKFIGILKAGTKISYDAAPGEHTLMVVGESADFIRVTVLAGKTYFARVVARPGAWKARFSFIPVRQADLSSSKFAEWYEKTVLVDPTLLAEEWAARNAPDIERKRNRYWPVWSEKSIEARASQTLYPEDGR